MVNNIWKEEDILEDGPVRLIINSRPGKQEGSKLYSIKLGRAFNYENEEGFMPYLRPQDLSKARLLLEEATYWIDTDRDENHKQQQKKGR